MNMRTISLGIAVLLMATSVVLAFTLTPSTLMARSRKQLDLEVVIPKAFGDWKAAPNIRLVEPPGKDTLSKEIYNQELARGYLDAQGHLVMLLIAYGESQSERLQLHRPEVCYSAQGFLVSRAVDQKLSYRDGAAPIAIRQLMTSREQRIEPIIYWMRIGYDVSEGLLERQRLKLEYGLRGLIPDGTLFRVSTIGVAEKESFPIEERFIRDLIAAVDPDTRAFIVGRPDKAFLR